MPNQVRILASSHTDFSLFETYPALIRVLRTHFDEVSDFEYIQTRYLCHHIKHVILTAYRRQCLINGQTTMVNTKDAVPSSKGRTVKTK